MASHAMMRLEIARYQEKRVPGLSRRQPAQHTDETYGGKNQDVVVVSELVDQPHAHVRSEGRAQAWKGRQRRSRD